MNLPVDTIDRKPLIKYGWLRAIIFGIAYFALMLALANIIEPLLYPHEPKFIELLADLLYYFGNPITLFIPFLICAKLLDRKTLKEYGIGPVRQAKNFLYGAMIGAGLIAAGFCIIVYWEYLDININSGVYSLSNPMERHFLFIALQMFLIALAEEIVFRGYILTNLIESFGKIPALIISSAIFSAAHLFNPEYSVLPIINIFIGGILLGMFFIYRGNIWFSVGLHFFWNYFQGPVFGFPVSGLDYDGLFEILISKHDVLNGGLFGFEASIAATFLMAIVIILMYRKLRPRKEM